MRAKIHQPYNPLKDEDSKNRDIFTEAINKIKK